MLKLPRLYGRSRTANEVLEYEPLPAHLYGVAKRARRFCKVFGAGSWGWILGLFHDMGKACQAFQDRLRGSEVSVDHPAHGAQYLRRRLGNSPETKALLFSICGHHGGLPNALTGQSEDEHESLHQRLTKRLPVIAPEYIREFDNIKIPRLRLPKEPYRRLLFTKMVFSSLVDADRLDAEAYGSPDRSALRGSYDSLPVLYAKLNRHLKAMQRSGAPTKVNRLRNMVQKESLASGWTWWNPRTWFRGFFTLTVPTGGAKTLASMAFALRHAVHLGMDRVIYIIPYTTIIEQNAEVFRQIFGARNVIEHHSNLDRDRMFSNRNNPGHRDSTDYTHHYLAAENWDAPIIVTTNVQFFESIYSHLASRCRRLHNVINSVVVLDEAHLLPARLLKPCIRGLKELVERYRCSAVLCTATQPGIVKANGLKWGIDKSREIVRNPEYLYTELERVRIDYRPEVKTDRQLTNLLSSLPQVLCVLNIRKHARLIYEDSHRNGTYHLSSLMCAFHRRSVLDVVRDLLRRGEPCRLISTQLVECGCDISFPEVVRNRCGVASIIQSAGRCNREGLLEMGHLIVTNVPHILKDDFNLAAERIAERFLRQGKNLLDCGTAEQAMVELYKNLEGRLDKPRRGGPLLQIINQSGMNIPFEEIGRFIFRMIETSAKSIIVPYDDRARELIRQLHETPDDFRVTRALHPYVVQVYPDDLEKIDYAIDYSLEPYRILRDMSIYDENVGLDIFSQAELREYRIGG